MLLGLSSLLAAEQARAAPIDAQVTGSLQKVIEDTLQSAERAPGEATAVLQGQKSAASAVSDLLCPPVRSIDELLREQIDVDELGAIGAGLTSLVCAAGLLQFDFHTTWVDPEGAQVTRRTSGLVGVPTPLDVDFDNAADLIGTLTITNLNTLEMVVERASGETAPLPVQVEAVLTDSERRVIGRDHLAFGYDARNDVAPGRLVLSTPLDALLQPGGEYRFDLAQQNRGEAIALIGSLFDGDPSDRTDPTEVRLDYGASPDSASVRAQLGDRVSTTLTTNRPGPASLSGRVVSEGVGQSADLEFTDLPTELDLALDPDTGTVTYGASEPVDRLAASVNTGEPFFLGANHFAAQLLDVPQAFELSVGEDAGNLSLDADQPIGQLDLQARSDNRAFPEIPAGEAGAVLDATAGELGLALRTFELRRLAVALDPLQVETRMQGGRTFTIDAAIDSSDESGDPGAPIEANALIDKVPSDLLVGLADRPPPPDGPGGSALTLEGSDRIEFLGLATNGFELLPGADEIGVEMNDVPRELTVSLPEVGQLAAIDAPGEIGQLRLVASDGSATIPADTYTTGTGNDLVRFRNVPGQFEVGVRMTALRGMGINLDPIDLDLEQDPAETRPLEIDADFLSDGGTQTTVAGLLNKPSASTSVAVDLAPGQPATLNFENAANVGRLELDATGLGSVGDVAASFDNLPRRLAVCLDPGPLCQRPNPHSIARRAPTLASLDFDDFGTQLPGQFTTFNATVPLDSGPVTITNLRFRNLGLDFEQENSTFSCLGNQVPRISMFFDSRSQPFVMNSVKFPPTIQDFRIGTDSQPANANNRIVRLNGARTIFGVCTGFNTSSAGTMACGGQRALVVDLGVLGNVNILNFLGFQLLPVCT